MKPTIIPSDKLSTLRHNLPRGSIKLISEKTGVCRETVARVLRGKSYREDVIQEALKIIQDFKEILGQIERITV